MISTEHLTGKLRWFQTYDLDKLCSRVLQQEWCVTTRVLDGVPFEEKFEWRSVPVIDGGLKV